MSSPTQRSLKQCRDRGWRATITERYNHHTRRRHDAFGFGDIHAIDGLPGSLYIQATSAAHVAERVTKIMTECRDDAAAWLCAGNRIQVWGWGQRVHVCKNGAKQKRWTLRIVPIELHDVGEPCACSFCAAVDAADEVLP